MMNWLVARWSRLPKGLRMGTAVVAAIGCVVACLSAGAVIGYLAWHDQLVQEKVKGMIAPQQLEQQFAQQNQSLSMATTSAVDTGWMRVQDTLRTIRTNVEHDYLQPMLEADLDLAERVKSLESRVLQTNNALDQKNGQHEQALRSMLHEIGGQPTNADVMEMLRAIRAENQKLQQRLDSMPQQRRTGIKL